MVWSLNVVLLLTVIYIFFDPIRFKKNHAVQLCNNLFI